MWKGIYPFSKYKGEEEEMTASQFAKFDNATSWTFIILWIGIIGFWLWAIRREMPKEKG